MAKKKVADVDRDPGLLQGLWLRGRNAVLATANTVAKKDLFHEMPVGEEESNIEKSAEIYELKRKLPKMLSNLQLIESEMLRIGEETEVWGEVTNNIYAEMGPYTPDVASDERKLLDQGTIKERWDLKTHGSLRKLYEDGGKSDKDIREKFGLETWPLPLEFPLDNTDDPKTETVVFRFPIPQGVPLFFDRGDIEVVRYYTRKTQKVAINLYGQFRNEIEDEVVKRMKKVIPESDWSNYKEMVENALDKIDSHISTIADIVMTREAEFRGRLEEFVTDYGGRINRLVEEVKKKSPAAKRNVICTRTFKIVKTVVIPTVFEGQEFSVKDDDGNETEWMGYWEKYMATWKDGKLSNEMKPATEGDYNPKKLPKEYTPEKSVAGYYELDNKNGKIILHTLKETGFKKRGDETDYGFDEYGYPLEVNDSGKVMLDVYRKEHQGSTLSERTIPNKFIREMPLIDSVNIVHNEWDEYRDTHRDARYHTKTPTAVEYAISMCPVDKPEWERYGNPDTETKPLRRLNFSEINSKTRGYKMTIDEASSPQTWTGQRKTSNLAPGLHLGSKDDKVKHPGKMHWHMWWDYINTELSPPGVVTTRGLSLYLSERINRRMKYLQDTDKVCKRFEGFDYGPRLFGTDFTSTPFDLKNIPDLNAPPQASQPSWEK